MGLNLDLDDYWGIMMEPRLAGVKAVHLAMHLAIYWAMSMVACLWRALG